jgi:hypothetical protein
LQKCQLSNWQNRGILSVNHVSIKSNVNYEGNISSFATVHVYADHTSVAADRLSVRYPIVARARAMVPGEMVPRWAAMIWSREWFSLRNLVYEERGQGESL